MKVQCQISDLEKSASVYQEQIDLVYDTIVSEILRNPENEKHIVWVLSSLKTATHLLQIRQLHNFPCQFFKYKYR